MSVYISLLLYSVNYDFDQFHKGWIFCYLDCMPKRSFAGCKVLERAWSEIRLYVQGWYLSIDW